MALKIETKLTRFPPLVCYLLARIGPTASQRHPGDEAIAKAAGMTVNEVRSLAWNPSWDTCTVEQMIRFSNACGVNLNDRFGLHNHANIIKRNGNARFGYLRKDARWKHWFQPILLSYEDYLNKKYST